MQTISLEDLPFPVDKNGWPWEPDEVQEDIDKDVKWPRISLITSSYNKEKYLEEAIRSVLLQNYPNLEYIIIDGGSTDHSQDLIKKYEQWLAYWVSEPDEGQAHAINKGINRATGDVVAWVHADDMLFPGACFKMAKAFLSHPDAALIYGAGAKIDANNTIVKTVKSQPYDNELIRTRCYIFQPSTFIKKMSLDNVGVLDESLHYWMDWDLYLRICKNYPVVRIEESIGMWRAHEETKTRTGGYTEQRREIALIGKKNNGLLDRNNVTYWVLRVLYLAEKATSLRIFQWMRAKAAAILDRLYGENTYYSAAMFEKRMSQDG